MKHHVRRLFIAGLQNSSAVVSMSVTNLGWSPVHRCEQQKHRSCAPYDWNRQAYDLPWDSRILRHRHESNTINPTQTFGCEKAVLFGGSHTIWPRLKNGPRHLVQCHAYQIQRRCVKFGVGHITVTGNETWIYSYDPKTKQQSSVWVFQDEPKLTKAALVKSASKRMIASFLIKLDTWLLLH